jgi:hypothetical protein
MNENIFLVFRFCSETLSKKRNTMGSKNGQSRHEKERGGKLTDFL